jgi:hypothetical protein
VYIYTSDCIEILYELPLLPNNTANETFLHKSGAVRSVGWILNTRVPTWRWLGEYDIGKILLQPSFQTGCSSSPSYFQIVFLIAVFEDELLRNIIITL